MPVQPRRLYSLVFPALAAVVWLAASLGANALDLDGLARAVSPWLWFRGDGIFVAPATWQHRFLAEHAPAIIPVLFVLWQIRWWRIAGMHYLRLQRPRAVAGALGIIVALAALIVEFVA